MLRIIFFLVIVISAKQSQSQTDEEWQGRFEQLGQELPTPNIYRTGDGSPGPQYWQQQADYEIEIRLNEKLKRIDGSETITYHNNSPHILSYLWIQLDQNRRAPNNEEKLTSTLNLPDSLSGWEWMYYQKERSIEGGFNIMNVQDKRGQPLLHKIQKTMMRIDLPTPLQSGEKFEFRINWWYIINNRMEDRGRSGYEYFPKDDNALFTIAQFYPRMAVYDDYEGWQHKQFLGGGEFTLPFGDFDVKIDLPADHIMMATGTLQNPREVLSAAQWKKYEEAKRSYSKPIFIVDQESALKNEMIKTTQRKTWHFKARNVRDFAFASSRKFIWEAQAVNIGGKSILAQSLYPKEGNPLWEQESIKAVINTLKTYSKYSINYPYPQATAIHTAAIGMEYPMICFNFGRPNSDGSFSDAVMYNMIGVIIHEVGHNFFPMIVNSDERQWTWMDEGINSFLEFRTQQECYDNFPSSRGPAKSIIPYMKGNRKFIRPIMTNSEQVIQLGSNAYGKPATALNILRETVLGQVTFDYAFKAFSEKWAFKHPKPADFFRTMEDASGVDLDWFWKGWFYTTDPVDIAIDSVIWYQLADRYNQEEENQTSELGSPVPLTILTTPDYYYWEFMDRLGEEELRAHLHQKEIYKVRFRNQGGLVMPIIVKLSLESGKEETHRIPAEVWRKNEYVVNKVFITDEPVTKITLDPLEETADIDTSNNVFPSKQSMSPVQRYKESSGR